MATRAEIARTDNSKLGRAVLNNRLGQAKPAPKKEVVPVVSKKKTTKKSSKK
ncbi:MAG: hypothetical protein H8D80_00205 [Proteobacteria bacterium]|nr:hypothetical protein [Pseudomonadota bacterium]